MDEEELKEQQKKQKQEEAGQKTAHVAGKAAATYFAPGVGGRAYDLASKTKPVQDLEKAVGNIAQKVPGVSTVTGKLNDAKALDIADKGLDLLNGKINSSKKGTDSLKKNQSSKNSIKDDSDKKNIEDKTNDIKKINDQDSSSNEGYSYQDENNSIDDSEPKKKSFLSIIIIVVITAFALILCCVVVAVASIYYPLEAVQKFITGIWDNVVDFFTVDQQELESKYYQKLKDVQEEISKNESYNICIDVNLITATLTVGRTFDEFLEDGNQDLEDTDENGNDVPYKKMTKQVELLAYMQIMNSKYSLDKNLKEETGSYCKDSSSVELVTADNQDAFDRSPFEEWMQATTSLDSSTPQLVAKNDKGSLWTSLLKRVVREKNYAYHLYYPAFDGNGNCDDDYAENMLPDDKAELSIGDYATRKDNVYYWNIVNDFIPEYYSDYLPDDEPARTEKIYSIADEIYLLYQQIGPSKTCAVAYAGPSTLCPNGITIENVGTFDFEEYIAGVVSRESYVNEGMEALKAQAVAARTYALNYTNYCQNVIPNNTNAQTFTQDINDRAREATNATRGEILVNRDGKIFSSQYDSFCYDDKDCPDSKRNSDGTYTVTYTKAPYGEQHTITLSDSSQYGRITHGQGHANGMSQLLSYQLAKQGMSYREILSYFYSDGVEINLVVSPTVTDGGTIIRGPISDYLAQSNSSIASMNQYIFNQVNIAGVGTREGVVAAAVSLVSGFYTQTGYKLPYELYPSGKYAGYGIDPEWGTNTGRTDYPSNGLDCSGFISWAIHNGGYEHVIKNAKAWGQSGASRNWFKGTTDTTARPGDLIYNAPASENGTSGHIRMIVDVTSDGYVVAEASSGKNGVRIKTISFTSTGKYYLVDMTNYYATATRVSDYPS